jgi:phosphoglycerate kinase
MFNKMTIRDVDISGKRVLIRVDYNVPLTSTGDVADARKIAESLPTINYAISNGAAGVILMSHLGRPKGKVVENLRLSTVAKKLEELIGIEVVKLDKCIGTEVEEAVSKLDKGKIILLENLRFHPEEEKNDPIFAEKLAKLADVYVNDGFSVCHRAHASVHAITKYFDKSVAGLLVEKEIEYLGKILTTPPEPFVIVIGGAKVSTKIGIVERLIEKANIFIIGGGMSYTFMKAAGKSVGSSLIEESHIQVIKDILQNNKDKIILPVDYKITNKLEGVIYGDVKVTQDENIPDGWQGVDVGPKSIDRFITYLKEAKCIFWNGPFGVIEIPEFSEGTHKLAYAIANSEAITIAGGGETDEVIDELNLAEKFNHVSTGGGACLELLQGKTLPGFAVLTDKK